MAVAVGISVANPYYCQALLPSVEKTFSLSQGDVLLGPMATQLGMALGVLFVLPLGDRTERRRMLSLLALGMAIACTGVVVAPNFNALTLSWFGLGIVALIPSLLPPFLIAFTPEAAQGRMLGIVLSGHFSGILLSRTTSGLLAQVWGWRTIYLDSAIAMVAIAMLFRRCLPALARTSDENYWALQASLLSLWRRHHRLRCSCLTQALLFGSFMSLWSALALHLAEAPWRFGPGLIGSFGLVGLASILAAPVIGRMVDRYGAKRIVVCGILCSGIGISLLVVQLGGLMLLGLGLMVLDLGVQGSFLANQARIYAIDPAARSRMSSLLFFSTYLGAASCSLVIAQFWASWNWGGTCLFALALVLSALLIEHNRWRPPANS